MLVRKHFLAEVLGSLLEKLWKEQWIKRLWKEIEGMSEQEEEIENPYEIVDVVETILEFNRQ